MIPKKPYDLLFLSSISPFILIFVYSNQDTYTWNIESMYYVISKSDFYKGIFIITFIPALLYLFLDKAQVVLNLKMTQVHVFGTLAMIIASVYFNNKNNSVLKLHNIEEINNQINYNLYAVVSVMLLICIQILFLMNIFTAQIQKLRISNKIKN